MFKKKKNQNTTITEKESLESLETRRIVTFLFTAYVMAFSFEVTIGKLFATISTDALLPVLVFCMFFPFFAVLFTRLITKEGMKNLWFVPKFKGNFKKSLIAYFGTALLIFLGSLLYFTIFANDFCVDAPFFRNILAVSYEGTVFNDSEVLVLAIAEYIRSFTIYAALFFIPALCVELGFRGYLLPKLFKKYSTEKAILFTGLYWGFWYFPIIVQGLHYGNASYKDIAIGFIIHLVLCLALNIIFSFLDIACRSVIPSAISLSLIVACGDLAKYFTKDGGRVFFGPSVYGIIGFVFFLAIAIVIYIKFFKGNDLSEIE